MRRRQDSLNTSRSSISNKLITTLNDSRILKQSLNPLFNIYQIEMNYIWCQSCQMNLFEKDVYNHIYEDQHIHILQKQFMRKNIKSASYHQQQHGIKLEIKQKSLSQQSILKRTQQDNLNKSIEITMRQSIKSLKQFVSKLIEDLNQIGYRTCLIVFLSETQCNINMFNELTFQEIFDKRQFFVIQKNKGPCYSINKQRIPEFLKLYIQKNLGSNKRILDQNQKYIGRQLNQMLRKCCRLIASNTKDKEYQLFLNGLKLKEIKGLSIQYSSDIKNQLQTERSEKIYNIQQNVKEQWENVLQRLGDQRQKNIRIVIKSKVQN
ncbi:unnamed protein product [Paramecium pentaurelia]|uniref:Uncharacterized protein n=1 Tax=Paramecium pentaurelia TaxID=43138 RepID=A0A8S1TTS3_9CILI|nr:unnamed protein product [Paramecium pentaurelia]